MTKVKIEPETILVNFFRTNLTDIHTSRSGQYVFDDFPLVKSLGDNSFPRVGIQLLSETGSPMGLFDDTSYDTVILQIDVVTKKDLILSHTVTDEALGTMSSTVNGDRMTYDSVPTTVTNIKHAGTAFGIVTLKNTDADFTAPASLSAGTVEVSRSTGNLNFSAADVTSYDTQAITSTYVLKLSNENMVRWIARDIIKQLRTKWRTDTTLNGLIYMDKISNRPIPLDEDQGIFRRMLEYRFNGFNFGEGI